MVHKLVTAAYLMLILADVTNWLVIRKDAIRLAENTEPPNEGVTGYKAGQKNTSVKECQVAVLSRFQQCILTCFTVQSKPAIIPNCAGSLKLMPLCKYGSGIVRFYCFLWDSFLIA